MKANKKFKLKKQDNCAYAKVVGGLVALLLMIIVGIMVFWETEGGIDGMSDQDETFTGYSHGDNASAQTATVDYEPDSKSDTNVTCYSSTSGTLSYPSFTLSDDDITITAGSASNYTQVNVSYTPKMAAESEGTTDMASTVFDLLPIIALAVVASIIIGVIMGFGGTGKSGGKF